MSTATLKMKFGTMYGEKTWSFKLAKTTGIASAVKNLANVMIENGSIYQYPPLTKVSAVVQIVSENAIDLSD